MRPACEACALDFTTIQTGDGPATFIMQIAGGIVVFGALFVQVAYNPPIWAMLLVALPCQLVADFQRRAGGGKIPRLWRSGAALGGGASAL